MASRRCAATIVALALLVLSQQAQAQVVNSEWNTGNGNWNVATNWFPNAVPDNGGGFTYDVEIGNLPVAAGAGVTFVPEDGTSDTISSLIVTNSGNPLVSGADLFTNGNQLIVISQTTINGSGSTIRVDDHNAPGTVAFNTDNLDLNNGGGLTMEGGIATVDVLFEINTGTLGGHGTVNVGDNDAVVEKVFENSSLMQPSSNNAAPQTLTIHANGVDTIDLDGDSETGLVDVSNVLANVNGDTVTLVIDGPLTDAFGGTLQIGQRDTVTFNDNFTLSTADVQMDGGSNVATLNGAGNVTSIVLSTFTVTGAAVIDNDLTFVGTTNSITLNDGSSLTLGGTVTIPDASAITRPSTDTLIITGSTTISEAAGDFDWDGGGFGTTTVSGSGVLTIAVDQVDNTGNDTFNGTLNLNDNGDLSVSVTAAEWQMAGTLNKNGVGTSNITGDRMVVTSTGNIVVNAGTLDTPAITLQAGSDVTVNGTLILGGGAELAGPATLTGTGTLRMEASSTVTANTTVNVSTFDWDGNAVGGTHTINAGVTFTINSANFDADGDMDDVFSLAGAGSQLVVSGPTQWTANGTITANAAAAGTATIGGTSRMILAATMNVDGNTTISAPLTLGASSIVNIDAGMTLNANGATTYAGVVIDGLGTYDAAPSNTVTSDSTINPDNFNMDAGNWTIESGAELTFNVIDYDPDSATNVFDTTITLNNGAMFVNSADPEFVMDGVLNMNASGGFSAAEWSGDATDIGNDAGALDADLNVTGDGNPNSQGRFFAPVDFNSDADVNVAAGASLVFSSTVNFDTVNAANNAEFTGAGAISFNNVVNVNEAVTLNMVGGTVDLDGNDGSGEFINIDAPLVINAATMSDFGRVNGGGGVNTLDINNNVGTGVLTVNLDDPNAEWTLNAAGVMNLVNDGGGGTLLAGNDVNLNGTVNVTGGVGISARIDIAGTINVAGASALTLQGSNAADPNRLIGGTINGPGLFSASPDRALRGFGTINSPVAFSGSALLLADDGTLTLNGAIGDVGTFGTADADGVLNVVNAWNSSVADNVVLAGGELKGGTVTVGNANGLQGHGLVSARVVNNTRLLADTGTLVFETAADDNDWDGAAGNGLLRATSGTTLDVRDSGPAFPFGGTVQVDAGARVFVNNPDDLILGFALNFLPAADLILNGGTYEAASSTDLAGTTTVTAGPESTIKVRNNTFLTFASGSTTTLNGNLRLENNNINVEAGATFSGGGALIVPDGSHMVADNLANVGVLLDMQGAFRPGNSEGIGRIDLVDYQQSNTGKLFVEVTGTALNAFDRLVASGDVVLDGYLNVDIDNMFVPVLGNTFNIITGNTVTGEFDFADVSGMPAGLAFHIEYLANAVQLQVVNKPIFSADFDEDGDVDSTDLAIWDGAFDLNQLGDADGDNDSDGNDFLLWQRQLGSAPAVVAAAAVPEPASLLLSLLALAALAAARSECRR